MIAGDTNAWIHFLSGKTNRFSKLMEQSLKDHLLVLPVPVLHELICYPELNDFDRKYLLELPKVSAMDQTWISASEMRKVLFQKKKKARAMDSLIAQICIERNLSLISDDYDMEAFVQFGLKLF